MGFLIRFRFITNARLQTAQLREWQCSTDYESNHNQWCLRITPWFGKAALIMNLIVNFNVLKFNSK